MDREIKADDEFKSATSQIDEELSAINEGVDFIPVAGSSLRIQFDIYIPTRIQDELLRDFISSQLNTQNFRIFITYRFYFPITFVQAVAPSEGCDPSDASLSVSKKMYSNRN